MLKRFMNWLLHRLQKAFGGLSGQRGRSRSSQFPQTPPATNSLAQRTADAIAAQNAEAAKADAIIPPLDHAEPSIPTPDLDPYRKLNAAGAALSIEEPAAPSSFAEVSVLLSTSSTQDANQTFERSPAENQSRLDDDSSLPDPDHLLNDHLPKIHDLLPAIETSPIVDPEAAIELLDDPSAEISTEEISTEEISTETDQTVVAEAKPFELGRESQPQAESVAPILSSSKLPTESPIESSSESPIEQAVLFSFDIIESQPQPRQLEEVALDPAPLVADSALQISLDIEAEVESVVTNDRFEHDPVELDQPSDSALVTDSALVKNGVVKLLFTLKSGNFHGYIEPDDGSKDILFHEKYINAEIFEHLDRGTRVVASIKYMEGKAYATKVHLLL